MDVQPDKQNLDQVFSVNTFHIDFYQRQYKWGEEPVKRLLDDIFYNFNSEYERLKTSTLRPDKVIDQYRWYYLNTYVTNPVGPMLYLVDGQQRLTTLTLLLMKLRHMAKDLSSGLDNWLFQKIVGMSGYDKNFWLNHDQHEKTMQALFEGEPTLEKIDVSAGVTSTHLVQNYRAISTRLEKELPDLHKFELFVFYVLKRLVLINLNVVQTDVPMVFEVINDRGVRLKPHEILKGKLLGQISKDELNVVGFNEDWDSIIARINAYAEDEIDQFFVYYLRAKHSDSSTEARKYDQDYHRVMMSELNLEHNEIGVKEFLLNDFKYYSKLYERILHYSKHETKGFEAIFFNDLTQMNMQFLLIMSCCDVNDPEEDRKLQTISSEVDRLFALLQLQRSYNSNDFTVEGYKLSAAIRNQPVDSVRKAFDTSLLALLSKAREGDVTTTFSYGQFKETGIELDKRFKRYFFARIERFIAENTRMNMRHNFYDLVKNTGEVNGFHVEHILAENAENYALFNNDAEKFNSERNRLGGLLLLKGRDNISSNNETYSNKLKSYANTLYWNETLREDTYKSKLDLREMMGRYELHLRPMTTFGPLELEERQQLLFQIAKHIWS